MRNFLKPIVCCSMLFSATFVMAEETFDINTPVHEVHGEIITLGHLILVYEDLPEEYKSLPGDQLFDGISDQLIRQTLLSQMLDKEDSQRIKAELENDRRIYRATKAMEKLISQSVTDEALRAYYKEKYVDSPPVTEYNASHILVETEEEALNLITKLEEGADFAELAQSYSTGPSGPSGGALGWFGKNRMVKPFETAVIAMEKETISSPVKTDFGWHVIRLNDTRSVGSPDYEKVKDTLKGELEERTITEHLDALLKEDGVFTFEQENFDKALIKNSALLEK